MKYGKIIMKVDGVEQFRFDATKTPISVLAGLATDPRLSAWLSENDPMPDFELEATAKTDDAFVEPEQVQDVEQCGETIVQAVEPSKSSEGEAELIPMRCVHKVPKRIRNTDSINEFLDPSGRLIWPDLKKGLDGKLVARASCANARVAILALKIDCCHDVFHGKLLVGGRAIEQWAGELSDHACQMLRVMIQKHFGFDPGRDNVNDAAVQLSLQSEFDPVLDYLDGLSWDGKKRLDTWLVDYLGAENTELNRVISRLALVAAVRRARQPGCKFDQIIVLEGPEGTQKSTAIATLAGDENFSDQTILGLDEKRHMELIKGKWLYEIADLAGMRRSEVEAVKAFASRTTDRGRPAYGRHVVEQPRRCVFFATTNDDAYLKSQTGNRRFWPVKTGRIAIEALRRDRDQLWAEAACVEAEGCSVQLPERLWAAAAAEQNKRLEHDPWDDILEGVRGESWPTMSGLEERIPSCELLLDYLKFPAERATKEAEKKLARCMQRLGWEGPHKMRIGGKPQRGYRRIAVPLTDSA